ncbi:MAG TPA: ankyrin repeat domain-containing protein [Vicinamibacterales bacterium]|nr:ankyrin repeat domain-containing protein [Vicinamibacterales bacterium]
MRMRIPVEVTDQWRLTAREGAGGRSVYSMVKQTTMRNVLLLVGVLATLAAEAAAQDLRLVQAAKAAEQAEVMALLARGADPNQRSADGTTALHWAVRNNDAMLVDRLLRAGARPHPENRYGVTPIALACESGSAAIVERLLKAGVSADATGPYGETALHTCAYSGNTAAVRVLLAAHASVDPGDSWRGHTPLMWAAAKGHPETMQALIDAGADVNARSTIIKWERQRTDEPRDKWLPPGGWTPLLLAARQDCVTCVDVLAAAGADLNIVDPERHTALIIALINGHYDVAGRLIDHGADLDMQDQVGQTALWAAVDAHTMPDSNRPPPTELENTLSAWDIVVKLVEKGAAVDVPLRQRVPYRTKIDRGADGILGAGTTPLLRAAKTGDAKVVELLLEHGANPRAAVRGTNGILLAANVGTSESDRTGRRKTDADAIETIRLLMKAGVDINAADAQGRTAAHGAALWGMTSVIRFLKENGVDLTRKDSRGLTPLQTALGLAGGFGFGGRAGVVREETAKVIAELTGVPLPDAAARAAMAAAVPQGGRAQAQDDDDPNN